MAEDLYTWVCRCGETNAMSQELNRVLRRTHQTFYCVHGHQGHYPAGKSEEQKLREQLDEERRQRQRAEQNVAMWRDDAQIAREEAEHQKRRANGYKGHATRITKRAKAGVCPCCNRTFSQLAQHMSRQHPEFTPDVPEPLRVVQGGKA